MDKYTSYIIVLIVIVLAIVSILVLTDTISAGKTVNQLALVYVIVLGIGIVVGGIAWYLNSNIGKQLDESIMK